MIHKQEHIEDIFKGKLVSKAFHDLEKRVNNAQKPNGGDKSIWGVLASSHLKGGIS